MSHSVAGLTEFEREDFIATRKEEILEAENRRVIAEMASRSSGKKKAAKDEVDDDHDEDDQGDDEVYTARGTRSRKTTGATKTKSEGFEKLKKSRTEKGKKKAKVRVYRRALRRCRS